MPYHHGVLRRSVPTLETSDVPLRAQMLASLRARAWVGDVRGPFSQGLRNQRALSLRSPPHLLPGKDDDIVIEILAEIYGLISGPPGWRRSLFTTFKELEFNFHPLAPCGAVIYEKLHGKENQFSVLICMETDDILGGGIGPRYQAAIHRGMHTTLTNGKG